ncbi:DEKNAAC103322 [Brettanomyces naardenensis]|uniref:DEKNAAC103322 n=1 Tax=Brettanomyces naardenensis TaxID=13370 RepID=A0A448YNH2_BRENA|nr:DEKNAAC103322 [Brettanomyces naardenensis]
MVSETGKITAWILATAAVTTVALETAHRYLRIRGGESPSREGGKHKRKDEEILEADPEYPDELIREQLARNYAFFGEESMAKIRDQFVVVLGAGGVGSNCVSSLARSGVSKIRVVDFDQVSLSSLNRHSVATLKDVGTPKVECLRRRLLQTAPWCQIEAIDEVFKVENADRLVERGNPDYVVDCIDNIDSKVDLLEYCYRKGLKTVSSMGASCKSDSTRVNIGDISLTDEDALAKSVRRRLRRRGINSGITCIFSAEKPDPRKAQLLPLPEEEFQKGSVDELSALQNFRVRILPVMGTMPGIFGLAATSHILTEAGGYPVEPIVGKNRYKVYDNLLQSLAAQEGRMGREQRIPISKEDTQYLLEEVFRGKSPISDYSTRLTISRWLPEKSLSMTNLVVMTKDEQRNHEKRVLLGGENVEDVYSPEVLKVIQKRIDEESWYEQFR